MSRHSVQSGCHPNLTLIPGGAYAVSAKNGLAYVAGPVMVDALPLRSAVPMRGMRRTSADQPEHLCMGGCTRVAKLIKRARLGQPGQLEEIRIR